VGRIFYNELKQSPAAACLSGMFVHFDSQPAHHFPEPQRRPGEKKLKIPGWTLINLAGVIHGFF
jgi:hypothetical protein